MDRVLIAISTCTRPGGVSYLKDTLDSMTWEGGLYDLVVSMDKSLPEVSSRLVFHDGPLGVTGNVDYVFSSRGKVVRSIYFTAMGAESSGGARVNLWRVLRHCSEMDGWDRLLFFEDDIKFLGVHSLLRMMTCPFQEDDGLITFHDMKELLPGSQEGLHRRPITGRDWNGLWGLQAVAFPRKVVEYLAARDFKIPWPDYPRSQSDRVVDYFLKGSPWPYMAVHCPSLVRHVGEVSAANGGETLTQARRSKYEAADDYDAGLLVGRPERRF